MSPYPTEVGGLEFWADKIRIEKRMLDIARKDMIQVWRYRGSDRAQFRREILRRIASCRTKFQAAQSALQSVKQQIDIRQLNSAPPAGLTAHQARHCITKLT